MRMSHGRTGWNVFLGVSLGLFLGTGCQKVASSSVKTSGIYADLSVTASGTGAAEVRAALRVGGPLSNTFLDLDAGDSLSAAVNGSTYPLARTAAILSAVSYIASVPVETPGTVFVIAFSRASEVSAPASSITLPAAFTISAPVASSSASRAANLDIKWNAAAQGDLIDLRITGPCVTPLTKLSQTDSGQITVTTADLKALNGKETSSCEITVELSRKKAGIVDPAFGSGGTAFGIQKRSVKLTSTP